MGRGCVLEAKPGYRMAGIEYPEARWQRTVRAIWVQVDAKRQALLHNPDSHELAGLYALSLLGREWVVNVLVGALIQLEMLAQREEDEAQKPAPAPTMKEDPNAN